MKIVFDTNVLISSVITKNGLASTLLMRVFPKHRVILSDYILHELEEKLTRKIELPQPIVISSINYFKNRCQIYNPQHIKEIKFKDVKDRPILALAKEVQAHYLITGDKDLIELKKFEETFILSIRAAVEFL